MARMASAIVLAAACGVLAACATVPFADEALEREAKALAVAPGNANVYVFRGDDPASALTMDVLLDGVPMGRSVPRAFFAFEVDPGRHMITSRAGDESSLVIHAEAGRSHFARQEARWGFARGRTALVAANAFGTRPFPAPGAVTVFTSGSPLSIARRAPTGKGAGAIVRASSGDASPARLDRKGAAAGAGLGALVGIGVGAAAVPVMRSGLAILVAVGSVAKGAEIGGMVGALPSEEGASYPSPAILRIVAD